MTKTKAMRDTPTEAMKSVDDILRAWESGAMDAAGTIEDLVELIAAMQAARSEIPDHSAGVALSGPGSRASHEEWRTSWATRADNEHQKPKALSVDDEEAIRAAKGAVSQKVLAEKYGVNVRTIQRAQAGASSPKASIPNAVWKPFATQFSMLFTDGAMEVLAKAIGPLIVEEFDGEPFGAKWDKFSERDKTTIRYIAKRGLNALTSYTYVERDRQERAASATGTVETEGLDPKDDGPVGATSAETPEPGPVQDDDAEWLRELAARVRTATMAGDISGTGSRLEAIANRLGKRP